MTNQEILQKAIVKAFTGGMESLLFSERELIYKPVIDGKLPIQCIYAIIFSHDFAKGFWGNQEIKNGYTKETYENINKKYDLKWDEFLVMTYPAWEYYLTEMVLEQDPIKYLEKFL